MVGQANSGVVNVQGQFTMSFDDLAPMTQTSFVGGTLTLDATSTPASAAFELRDNDGGTANGVNIVDGDGGFEDTTFSGFANLIVRGGDNSELVTLTGLDPTDPDGGGGAAALTSVTPQRRQHDEHRQFSRHV